MDRFSAWAEFHTRHPAVFDLFCKFARQARAARGSARIGARMVGERIRWHSFVDVESTDGEFKFNDHLWPYYARLAMAVHADLAGAFERRDERFDATDDEIVAVHRGNAVGGPA
jgi:hypothetical protein